MRKSKKLEMLESDLKKVEAAQVLLDSVLTKSDYRIHREMRSAQTDLLVVVAYLRGWVNSSKKKAKKKVAEKQ